MDKRLWCTTGFCGIDRSQDVAKGTSYGSAWDPYKVKIFLVVIHTGHPLPF